jgi:choline-sulfatase
MNALGFDDVYETTGPWATQRSGSILTDRWKELGLLETFRDDYRRRKAYRGEHHPGSPDATWSSPLPEGEHMDDFVGRTAVAYLSACDRDEPFAVFVGFGGPHEPWDPPESWSAKYADAPTPDVLPKPEAGDLPPAARAYQEAICALDIAPEEAQAMQRQYFAKIAHIDGWFGRILETLEDRGALENTFILFWSDHGERLADRGGLYKSVFYDESARVPLVVRRPDGVGAGAVADALVGTADMPATICAAAGVEPVGLGRSVLPATEDPSAAIHDCVCSEIEHVDRRATMVRTDRHKLVVDADGNALQLFDMEADPQEMENLVGRPEHAATERELREALLGWHLRTGTPLRCG